MRSTTIVKMSRLLRIAAPVIVITKKEAPVELQVPARFATLLLPVVKVGAMDKAKIQRGMIT